MNKKEVNTNKKYAPGKKPKCNGWPDILTDGHVLVYPIPQTQLAEGIIISNIFFHFK